VWLRGLSSMEIKQVYDESRQGDSVLFQAPSGGMIPAVAAVAPGKGSFLPWFK